MIEIDREVTSTLLDLHLSSLSARMNEIMKVLTIIATIFIPLGFVASLYGMNFDPSVSPWNMPELHWRYGYPYALLVMTAMAFGMLAYFLAKGWIGGRWRRGGSGGRRPAAAKALSQHAEIRLDADHRRHQQQDQEGGDHQPEHDGDRHRN
jgi:hypothetical protein